MSLARGSREKVSSEISDDVAVVAFGVHSEDAQLDLRPAFHQDDIPPITRQHAIWMVSPCLPGAEESCLIARDPGQSDLSRLPASLRRARWRAFFVQRCVSSARPPGVRALRAAVSPVSGLASREKSRATTSHHERRSQSRAEWRIYFCDHQVGRE